MAACTDRGIDDELTRLRIEESQHFFCQNRKVQGSHEEIRNPKLEIRNKFEIRKPKQNSNPTRPARESEKHAGLGISILVIVSDFGFRILHLQEKSVGDGRGGVHHPRWVAGPWSALGLWSRGCRQTLTDWGIEQDFDSAVLLKPRSLDKPLVGVSDCLVSPYVPLRARASWLLVKRAFGDFVELRSVLLHVGLPALSVPELQLIADAQQHALVRQAGKLHQPVRDQDAAAAVEFHRLHLGEEQPAKDASLSVCGRRLIELIRQALQTLLIVNPQ